ncbi:MAG: cytochrome c oxidase assembly protein [Alphaproteobacteria bacterium]|nr:cytochrome c oxidase assembly protein [Alphaproteobacteria bacterium]
MRRPLLLACGAVVALATVLPPLVQMAGELFALHMLQHLLLVAVAAPLLAAALDCDVKPVTGWCAFVGIFLFWHWPAAFRWAALHPAAELFELLSILAAAILFWSAAFSRRHASYGARALLVMTAAVATDLPGVVMVFAPSAVCTMPGENALRFGLTPLEDQQIAGLLMWVPANLIFFGLATFLFARWMTSDRELVTP